MARKSNPHHIDNVNTYRETLYIIKNYAYMLKQREQILYGSPEPSEGMPKRTETSDPTFSKTVVLATLESKIKAIEQTVCELRKKYSHTYTGETFDAYGAFSSYETFCYYRSKKTKDLAPCYKTWKRYRSEFVWNVAKKLNFF